MFLLINYLTIIWCAWHEPFNNNSVQSRDIMGKRALLHVDTMAIYNSHSGCKRTVAPLNRRKFGFEPFGTHRWREMYLCLDSYSAPLITMLCLNIIIYFILNKTSKDMTGGFNLYCIPKQNSCVDGYHRVWLQSCQKKK